MNRQKGEEIERYLKRQKEIYIDRISYINRQKDSREIGKWKDGQIEK